MNNRNLTQNRLQTSVGNPFQLGVYAVVMFYNFFDIFVVTHFGNEIKFSSGLLSYCLFESKWIDQSESSKKCIFILMEVLKRPQELVIGKVYPLDLAMFTKVSHNPKHKKIYHECIGSLVIFAYFFQILRLAYSMFNILQSFKWQLYDV